MGCDCFKLRDRAGRPGETAHIAESTIQQTLYESGSNEAGCACYQDRIVRPDYESVAFHVNQKSLLLGDVWLSYRVDAQECKELA